MGFSHYKKCSKIDDGTELSCVRMKTYALSYPLLENGGGEAMKSATIQYPSPMYNDC